MGIISGSIWGPFQGWGSFRGPYSSQSGDHWCCFNCRPRGTVNSEPRVLPFSHGPVQQFHLQFKHVSRTKEEQTWVFYLVAWFSHLIIKLSPNKIQLWMIISCPWWCRWGVHCEQKIGTAKTTEVKCSSFNLVAKTYHGRSNAGTPWQARACVKIQIKLKSNKSLHHYYGLTFALRVNDWGVRLPLVWIACKDISNKLTFQRDLNLILLNSWFQCPLYLIREWIKPYQAVGYVNRVAIVDEKQKSRKSLLSRM